MNTPNWKIFLAITLSLLIFFGGSYLYKNYQTIKPPNLSNFKNLLAQASLKNLITFNFSTNNGTMKQWSNRNNSFTLPTSQPSQPTQPIKPIKPTPTNSNQPQPTRPIPLSSTPKPTQKPQPTVTPPPQSITSDVRPGKSLEEIFQDVSRRECIPAALLMAFKTEETGDRFKNDSSSTIQTYNIYGWWKTGAGDPCYGFGYHTQTGIVPSDSVKAGTKCATAASNQTDLGIMGLIQISQWEQDVSRKYTTETLPNNIDRRVLFDNALIFAIITKNRVGNQAPDSCTDWPDDIVRLAAEKHYGTCGDNYCDNVLRYYKQYK